jgi:hypothetical protein
MPTHKKDTLVCVFSELKRLFGSGIFRMITMFPLCCYYQEFRNSATAIRRGPVCRIYRRHFYRNLATASALYSPNYPSLCHFQLNRRCYAVIPVLCFFINVCSASWHKFSTKSYTILLANLWPKQLFLKYLGWTWEISKILPLSKMQIVLIFLGKIAYVI